MRSFRHMVSVSLAALAVAAAVAGCTQVQEPWKRGDQYQQERMRSPQATEMLDHRLNYTQTDR